MNSDWSYSPETPNLGQIRRFLEPCDLEIWCMTLKSNRTLLLCNNISIIQDFRGTHMGWSEVSHPVICVSQFLNQIQHEIMLSKHFGEMNVIQKLQTNEFFYDVFLFECSVGLDALVFYLFSIHRTGGVFSFGSCAPLLCQISTHMKLTLNQYDCHKWNIKMDLVNF